MPHLGGSNGCADQLTNWDGTKKRGLGALEKKKVADCQYIFDKPMLFVRCKTFIILNKTRRYWKMPTIIYLKFKKIEAF